VSGDTIFRRQLLSILQRRHGPEGRSGYQGASSPPVKRLRLVDFHPLAARSLEELGRKVKSAGKDRLGPGPSEVPDGTAEGLVGLPAGPRPGGPPEELGRIDLQDGGQFPDDLQADVGHGPLHPAQVCPVHLGVVGQLFLGHLPLMPEPAKVRRKKLAKVHVPSQPNCGLFAHGFKAENAGTAIPTKRRSSRLRS
jgi:hypothetical protein